MIERVSIRNYRRFRKLDLALGQGLNIIVGQNDAGKSTLLEAINLALTGKLHGRALTQALNPYLVNDAARREFCEAIRDGKAATPPSITIELQFAADDDLADLQGTNNMAGEDAPGICIEASFNNEFLPEYEAFIDGKESVDLVPTEYYKVEWRSFKGSSITRRSIPASAALIDASNLAWKPGVDYQIQSILDGNLEPRERAELSREYRSVREAFRLKDPVVRVNGRLRDEAKSLTTRDLSLAIDISQRHTWESSLALHLDDLPVATLGKGEQNSLKTMMALGRDGQGSNIVLLEEPEANLSFSNLRRLLAQVEAHCKDKQVIVSTHSSYVLNKLGLDRMLLLSGDRAVSISDLSDGTMDFFKRLPGYDTLRLVLCDEAILVEGPSDELIVQRAYRDANGKHPIEDGVDVISVGTSHKRFLELAALIERRVRAVRDNDGKEPALYAESFKDYLSGIATLHVGPTDAGKTLEPQILSANGLAKLNEIFGTSFDSDDALISYMTANKTECAYSIFESTQTITMPPYIAEAIARD